MGGEGLGLAYGSTDDIGYYPAEKPVEIHDLQATLLHQLGLDPYDFGVMQSGLKERLIGPSDLPDIIHDICA